MPSFDYLAATFLPLLFFTDRLYVFLVFFNASWLNSTRKVAACGPTRDLLLYYEKYLESVALFIVPVIYYH